MKGKVKWYDLRKGYGFIEVEGEDDDIFIHRTSLPEGVTYLQEEDEVEFEVEKTERGPKAINVKKL